MAMKYAVEHWRRSMPRCMGALYWQLNDCWPVASWASIDSHGRWKALQYMARRFYAPVLVSGVEDLKKGTVFIFVTNDLDRIAEGALSWRVTSPAGMTLSCGKARVRVAPRKSMSCGTVRLSELLRKRKPHELLLWLDLEIGGSAASENLVLLARPKHIDLEQAAIRRNVKPLRDGSFSVSLTTDKPALWTWLELADTDAKVSDNFFSLSPGRAKEVVVRPAKPISAETFVRKLTVRSLVDTYGGGERS
jgi:beta-mannosidase